MKSTTIRGSTTTNIPDFEPRIDIFHYGSMDNLEKVLVHNTLGFNSLLDFNDLFESEFNFSYHFKGIENYELFISQTRKHEQTHSETIKEFINNTLAKMGVCCFSKTPYEPLMWAHYTDKHKGICYCFDRGKIFDRKSFISRDVKYTNELPKIDFFQEITTIDIIKPQIEEIIFTKSNNWSYEKEFRYYKYSIEKSFNFNPKSLNGVIIGYRCNEIKKVDDLIKQYNKTHNTDVKLMYAKPSINEYLMDIGYTKTRGSKMGVPIYNPKNQPL